MWLIVLFYLLMASTFTLAKTAVFYMHPIYFIGLRMIIAGGILLGYLFWFKKEHWRSIATGRWQFAQIAFFHIYCAYVFEFWALQYLTSSKACLLYNLSPFFTALLMYLLFNHKLSAQKWMGLLIGFVGMLPILIAHTVQENLFIGWGFLSLPELALLFAVASACYGWIIMQDLVVQKGYNPMMINGVGMSGGGIAALLTAFIFEGFSPFLWPNTAHDALGNILMPILGPKMTTIAIGIGCLLALIIIANIIGYNLYGNLLRKYSATLLSFAGFITPFFASIFGWIFLAEPLTMPFIASLAFTILGLYLFYEDEMRKVA
jgi:drug/metabolite transporter (DMT)-like permease